MQMDDTIENTTLISRKHKTITLRITETAWPETKKDRRRNSRNDSDWTSVRKRKRDHHHHHHHPLRPQHTTETHTHTLLTKHPAAAPLRAGGGGASDYSSAHRDARLLLIGWDDLRVFLQLLPLRSQTHHLPLLLLNNKKYSSKNNKTIKQNSAKIIKMITIK